MQDQVNKQSWKKTLTDPITLWIITSFCVLIASYIWRWAEPENLDAPVLTFCSWLSSLLAIGYLSTPSGSWYGKVCFLGVIVMVGGIGFKILHLPYSNALIIVGLMIIAGTYVFMWRRER